MANQIHVVPHFHWDREWYFTAEESKILLVNDMEEIMDMLEKNPDYPCFVMDGQTAVLEDYLSVKPENRDRLEHLIRENKLIIGPWYTQTDEMVVGGESIVRNLLYGKLDCEQFGPRMMIGYLPDSFGQSSRLPQILNGFGIKRCMFWRGTSERMGSSKTEFIWEGDDNSQVVVQLLPLGYAIGKYLPEDEAALKERMDKYLPVLDRGATTDHILLPNGHDQMPIQKNIFAVMKKIEQCYPGRTTVMGRYEDVFDIIEKQSGLDVLRGEFLDGKYMRVHRSIYSSRADLKSANTRIENKVTNILEPLAAMAYSLGFEYHHGFIEAIWKELLKNHAHDSIGCCCSDKVHRAIADRFFLAEDRADNLIRFYMRKLVDAMSCEEGLDKFTVFNTLPYARKEVVTGEIITRMKNFELEDENGRIVPMKVLTNEIVDPGLIDRQIVHYGNYDPFVKYTVAVEDYFPAMGYRTYFVRESDRNELLYREELDPRNAAERSCTEFVMANRYYRISIEENGTLSIEDRQNGEVYRNVLLVEDGSDDGDGYDYSPLEQDFVLTSEKVKAERTVENGDYVSTAKIRFTMDVPANLESRRAGRCDGKMEIAFSISIEKDSSIIRVRMDVNNQADDHRVRVLIPNNIGTQWSVSDNQFGTVRRPVRDQAMDVWKKEKWSERPDSIYPFLSYVKQENETGLAVLTNSVREYELTGDEYDTIAVTVFRSVGVLGKEKLYRRPGRPSGIKMETPDSQMKGENVYEFALTSDMEHVSRKAKEYTTPLITYNKMPYNAMKLNTPTIQTPYSYSLLQIENPDIIMSVLKKEEQGDGLLFRCYNGTSHVQTGKMETEWNYAGEMMLDETAVTSVDPAGELRVEPNQIRTILLKK